MKFIIIFPTTTSMINAVHSVLAVESHWYAIWETSLYVFYGRSK